MSKQQKYYVVWHGRVAGIYQSWTDCEQQVKGFDGARYKSFKTAEEAENAFRNPPPASTKAPAKNGKASPANGKAPTSKQKAQRMVAIDGVVNPPDYRHDTVLPLPLEVTADALAVDAACSGNPGQMEYRGVYLKTGQVVFHYGPIYGTNNIGEFLAIVHALALLKQKAAQLTIYSDSRNALLWVKGKKCKTKLPRTPRTEQVYSLVDRAERWLQSNDYKDIPILKWETSSWGEIPADFGRK